MPTLSGLSDHPQPAYQELRATNPAHVPINCGTRVQDYLGIVGVESLSELEDRQRSETEAPETE